MTKLIKALLPGSIVMAAAIVVWLLFLVGLAFAVLVFQFGGEGPPTDLPYFESVLIYLVIALGVGIGGFVWFLPTTIAALRGCRSYWGILVLNLIPGLGHVIALVWALVEQPHQTVVVHHFQTNQNE